MSECCPNVMRGETAPPIYYGVMCPLDAFVHHGPLEQDTLKVHPVGIPSGTLYVYGSHFQGGGAQVFMLCWKGQVGKG